MNCPLCHCPENVLVGRLRDRLLDFQEEFSLARCKACGLHFLDPPPTAEQLIKAYPEEYAPYRAHRTRELSWWQKKGIRYGLRKRSRVVEEYKSRGRLLEIGCADGLFLDYLRSTGNWDTYGVEISPSAARTAREKFGLEIFQGELEEARLPDRDFDAVVMWDVLEHLSRPLETLREIQRVLKPDGVLIFRIPQLDCWERKAFGPYWSGWDPPRHLAAYSVRHLDRLLGESGFKMIGRACRGGTYPALVLSVFFWCRDFLPAGAQRLVRKILGSLPVRLFWAPFIKIADKLRKSSALTVAAEKI